VLAGPRARELALAGRRGLAPGRYLAIADGGEVVHVALEGPEMTIGRRLGADVCFDDVSVSRRHARLFIAHEVALIDERSLNGVWVNGERVARAVLRDGDSIAIGSIRLRYLAVPGNPPPEAA
jgi:pSer/pThr/pTyr-binding forkhead associated (FHA) protein